MVRSLYPDVRALRASRRTGPSCSAMRRSGYGAIYDDRHAAGDRPGGGRAARARASRRMRRRTGRGCRSSGPRRCRETRSLPPELEVRPFDPADEASVVSWIPDEAAAVRWGGPGMRWPVDAAQFAVMRADPDRTLWTPTLGDEIAGHFQLFHDRRRRTMRLGRVRSRRSSAAAGWATPLVDWRRGSPSAIRTCTGWSCTSIRGMWRRRRPMCGPGSRWRA